MMLNTFFDINIFFEIKSKKYMHARPIYRLRTSGLASVNKLAVLHQYFQSYTRHPRSFKVMLMERRGKAR